MVRIPSLLLGVALLAVFAPVLAADDTKDDRPPHLKIDVPAETRPKMLPALYGGLAGLQMYDGYSTLSGLGQSVARESNPLVGSLASQPAALWTLKAVSTMTSIYFAEQLWRQHHRTQAVVMMILANGMMGAVAAHNASVLKAR